MIIICGRTIAEVEHDLEMAKAALATGAPIGVGGATLADVEQAMRGLYTAMGEHSPTEHKCDCACGGGICYGCGCAEEEEVEICPVCDCELDEDGYCDNCGYPNETEDSDLAEEEDEELTLEDIDRLVDEYNISAEEVDDIVNKYGLPTICGEMVKRALGL
jgi:hypothetical protein